MKQTTLRQFSVIMAAGFLVLLTGAKNLQAADDEIPSFCTNDLGWTVTLVGEPVPVENPSSCNINGQLIEPCYLWTYQVQNTDFNTKGLNHINFNIPVVASEAVLIGQSYDVYSATVAIYDPGAGDPTTSFGRGILQDYVVKFTPQSTDGIWTFLSNSGKLGTATVGLKINNSLSVCEIGGPDSPGYPIMAVATAQNITTADKKNFRIVEDPYTQCILKAFEILPDGTERELTKSEVGDTLIATGEGYDDEPLVYFGVPGQGCPRSIVKADGPNTWYFISGRWIWR